MRTTSMRHNQRLFRKAISRSSGRYRVRSIGSGAVRLFAGVPSLGEVVPPLARRLTNVSLGLFFFLAVWVCILSARSALVLLGNEGV